MTKRLWILGAADPEMNVIEDLLRACGERVEHALVRGERVSPAEAYRARLSPSADLRDVAEVYLVECDLVGNEIAHIDSVVRVDHHRPGDPGYGRPPAEFLPASSLGQVIAELARCRRLPASWQCVAASVDLPAGAIGQWPASDGRHAAAMARPASVDRDEIALYAIPADLVITAAADHCLAAAYAGQCPGVDPDALMRWRAETRAAYQKRSVADVLADVEKAREVLRGAPLVELRGAFACDYHSVGFEPGCGDCTPALSACDLRGRTIPELPEAAAREGAAYLANVTERDGRRKVVLGGHTSPETVKAFLETWAPAQGLTGIYGDPARGFAGGYLP